jgi:hypothetical protein
MTLHLSHSAQFWLSADSVDPAPVNSDGSGMKGGTVKFYTSQPGHLYFEGAHAWGGTGEGGGDGGKGGSIALTASGGNLYAGTLSVDGGLATGEPDSDDGGAGGDAGTISLTGPTIINVLQSVSTVWLVANGGFAGLGSSPATAGHPNGFLGGNGGKGGSISVYGAMSRYGSFPAEALGGDGNEGTDGYSPNGTGAASGYPGGNGGAGGAAGTLFGLGGRTTPGAGADGGWGGWGESANWNPVLNNYDAPGGTGGAGGNGGNSGGPGALPGKGGKGGNGGPGNPNGADGPDGLDGQVGP